MEFRTGGFSVFLTVMMTAVMDRKSDAGKSSSHIVYSDPIRRFLRVIVVAVDRQTVAADEVVVIAIMVFIFRTYIIVTDSCLQTGFVCHIMAVGIRTVAGVTGNVRAVKGKHQSYTSLASSSSTFVMNFSARIVVSSSQSPPSTTSKPSSA